jgi:hypothetical protein
MDQYYYNNRLYYIYARHCLLILSKNKENVTFTWATGVQNVLFVTITGDKFGIYVPICQLFILHIVICFYIFCSEFIPCYSHK